MTEAPGRWGDLPTRIGTSVVLLVVGGGLLWLGGPWFLMLAAGVTGAILWEMTRMIEPDQPAAAMTAGLLGFSAVLLARAMPDITVTPILLAVVLVLLRPIGHDRALYAGYAFAILVAGYALGGFLEFYGLAWFIWLVLVVVTTDIMGYFGGRLIGGPKFWPAVSPKKTWAGILCGWAGAALVGAAFAGVKAAGFHLVWIAVLVSFASQMGDIAESAYKRRMGRKDASDLLPGHGGFWDRFDGLLGAAVMMQIVAIANMTPAVSFPVTPPEPAAEATN